jgi:hypothetical protein
MISRTRRRDIGAFTTRKPRTEAVPFTPEQQAVHDAILEVQRAVFQFRDALVNYDIPWIQCGSSSASAVSTATARRLEHVVVGLVVRDAVLVDVVPDPGVKLLGGVGHSVVLLVGVLQPAL